jgi:hypothetical protein
VQVETATGSGPSFFTAVRALKGVSSVVGRPKSGSVMTAWTVAGNSLAVMLWLASEEGG